MDFALLTFALGILVTFGAQLAAQAAERRAKETYHRLTNLEDKPSLAQQTGHALGNRVDADEPDVRDKQLKSDISGLDSWNDIRPLVGGWGCLYISMQFMKGAGILSVILSVAYLILLFFG